MKSWKALKKLLNDDIDVILYEDESMIRDYQAIMKTWFPIGQQRIIPFHCRLDIRSAVLKFIDYINSIPLTVIDRLCV